MNLAVIGSGGREHAICYKLEQSSKIKNLNNVTIDDYNQVFHGGTYERNNSLSNISKVNWGDVFFRKDIGWRAIISKYI